MEYQIIEAKGVSAVFPKPFRGPANDVVAVGWKGKVYSGLGKKLDDTMDLPGFCGRLGIRPEKATPRKEHTAFLQKFLDAHFPRSKPKPKEPPKPPRELTPAERRHQEVLRRMQAEFKGQGKGDKITLTLLDKHGKEAQATHMGKGKFEPVVPREDGGTKLLARNRWASKQFTDRYRDLDSDLHAEELRASEKGKEG